MIVVDDVRAGYPGHEVLRGVSCRIPSSEVTALCGGNGAGKTTLLDVVAGVSKPWSGRVERPSGGTAYVPQRTQVDPRLPLTVRQVVTMGAWQRLGWWRPVRETDRYQVSVAMSQLGIEHLARQRIDELSGGQVQRTLVARAVATGAPTLVLDEPMTGLDVEVRAELSKVFRELAAEGRIVLQATHDEEAAAASDLVLTLRDGAIADAA